MGLRTITGVIDDDPRETISGSASPVRVLACVIANTLQRSSRAERTSHRTGAELLAPVDDLLERAVVVRPALDEEGVIEEDLEGRVRRAVTRGL
jgi:hypothetical protein